jgi:hypothetical protein
MKILYLILLVNTVMFQAEIIETFDLSLTDLLKKLVSIKLIRYPRPNNSSEIIKDKGSRFITPYF